MLLVTEINGIKSRKKQKIAVPANEAEFLNAMERQYRDSYELATILRRRILFNAMFGVWKDDGQRDDQVEFSLLHEFFVLCPSCWTLLRLRKPGDLISTFSKYVQSIHGDDVTQHDFEKRLVWMRKFGKDYETYRAETFF